MAALQGGIYHRRDGAVQGMPHRLLRATEGDHGLRNLRDQTCDRPLRNPSELRSNLWHCQEPSEVTVRDGGVMSLPTLKKCPPRSSQSSL